MSADSPRINSLGQVAFFGQTSDGRFGAFLFSGGSISKVAASGDTPLPSVTFTYVGSPLINDLGEIAFGADLSDGTVATFLATPVSGPRPAGYSDQAATQERLSISRERAQVLKARHPQPLTHGNRGPVTQSLGLRAPRRSSVSHLLRGQSFPLIFAGARQDTIALMEPRWKRARAFGSRATSSGRNFRATKRCSRVSSAL